MRGGHQEDPRAHFSRGRKWRGHENPEAPPPFNAGVKIGDRGATVDGMYLRIIIHDNEHVEQLVAYARMNGIVPPWSDSPR